MTIRGRPPPPCRGVPGLEMLSTHPASASSCPMLGTLCAVTTGVGSLCWANSPLPTAGCAAWSAIRGSRSTDDIEALVRAHGVPEAKVWMVCGRVATAHLDRTQLWAWTMAFDGTKLAHLCGSPLIDVEVAIHVAEHTTPSVACPPSSSPPDSLRSSRSARPGRSTSSSDEPCSDSRSALFQFGRPVGGGIGRPRSEPPNHDPSLRSGGAGRWCVPTAQAS